MHECGVVIPVYNGLRGQDEPIWLRQAIESALASEHDDFCVTIVDDGSTDDTLDVVHEYVQDNLTVISYPENKGVTHALNLGIKETDAAFIATLGSDDLTLPRRLKRQADLLLSDSRLMLVGCHYETVDVNGISLMIEDQLDGTPETIRIGLISGKCKIGAPMFRKSLWGLLNGFDERSFPRCAEDFDFFLRAVETFPDGVGIVPEVLYQYRTSAEQLTKEPYFEEYWRAIDMSRERRRNARSNECLMK